MTAATTTRASAEAYRDYADALLALLRNIGVRGNAYDRVLVQRYQQTFNQALPVLQSNPGNAAMVGFLGLRPLTVDGLWGFNTAKTVNALFRGVLPNAPAVPERTNSVPQWWTTVGTYVTRVLAELSTGAGALVTALNNPQTAAAQSQTGAEVINAVQQTSSNVGTTEARTLTDPTVPPLPSPPPEGAGRTTQTLTPTQTSTPTQILVQRLPAQLVAGSRATPLWIFWGLGILSFAGIIGWAAWRKKKRRQASTGNRA